MTDIVERIRGQRHEARLEDIQLLFEAADEIERLREQICGEKFEANLKQHMANEIELQRDRAIWLQEQLEEFQKATA